MPRASDAPQDGRPTFVFAGGGTGGHLFPALAIAESISARHGQARHIFLCSSRPLDERILGEAGVEHIALPAQPVSTRPRGVARFLRGWGPSVRASRGVIRSARAQGPVVVVAMGGFVAAPVAIAARAERTPLLLVNLDAAPGKANRLIARRAQRTLDASPGGPQQAGWTAVAPIVRRGALADGDKEDCRRRLGLEPDRPTLMITGGSQGARSINALIERLLRDDPSAFAGWQALHQAGPPKSGDAVASLGRAYADADVPALVTDFCSQMSLWWGAADLTVCRAGAGTVAEAWANRVPALFLPYPYHADEHQRRNAEPLVQAGAALLARDHIEPDRNLAEAGASLRGLLREPAKLAELARGAASLPPADGADRIAHALLDAAWAS